MIRPSRLVNESLDVGLSRIPFEMQEGDELTGFEIIASLPVEEQQRLMIHLPKVIFEQIRSSLNIKDNIERFINVCQKLYTWNG